MKKIIKERKEHKIDVEDTVGKFTTIHEWVGELIPVDVPDGATFSVETEYYYEGSNTFLIWRWEIEREETDSEEKARERREARELAAKIKRREQREREAKKALEEERKLYEKLKKKYES